MRDGDHLVAESEREEQLGGVRHEADDPHEETSMAPGEQWRQEGESHVRDIDSMV